MRRPLSFQNYLTLREAADRIGQERYGDKWSPEFRDDKTCDPHKVVREELYKIIGSHDVPAFIDDGTGERRLVPDDTVHFAFHLDLKAGLVTPGQSPGRPFEFRIKRSEFEDFLKRNRKHRGTRHRAAAESECYAWLMKKMQAKERKAKGAFFEEAQRELDVEHNAFKRAWRRATATDVGSEYRNPGRPKSDR